MTFPEDFVWGAATSAYQIEGSVNADGRGTSVWDMFCKKSGKTWEGQSGNVACDHYNRYQEDVKLMKEIGISAYRLSISWPRVIPGGVGKVNSKGLRFYDNLINNLLEVGITPYVTLFHWDYPYELYSKGGWLNKESSNWFADYAAIIVDHFSDRVQHWITINEPQVFVGFGHQDGRHAPGDQLDLPQLLMVGHNVLLSHGKAVQVIRARSKLKSSVSIAPAVKGYIPATKTASNIEAARRETFAIRERNCWDNSWWTDPVYLGKYPEDGMRLFGDAVPVISNGDMQTICQPLDFCAMNVYFGTTVIKTKEEIECVKPSIDEPLTEMGWPITPKVLYWATKFFWERYRKPIVITENGMSLNDIAFANSGVHDNRRINFLQGYLSELRDAYRDGVDIKGYFYWSLLDNFEWSDGYRQRFGLIYTDYLSQKRVIKDSGYWYRDLIKSQGKILETPQGILTIKTSKIDNI